MHNEPLRVQENQRTRVGSIHKRAPHRTPSTKKKIESHPRPEPIRHVSFDEPVPKGPFSAPLITSPYPHGRPARLPRCKSRSPQIAVVPLPPASAPIVADNSPLSSAETLAEVPQEVKRALSSRLTRTLLLSRGRQLSRTSTVESNTTASPTSVAEISEFGERKAITGKVEMRSGGLDAKQANLTERGRFGFLKKSKTIPAERMSFLFLYSSLWSDVIHTPDRPRSRSRPPSLSLPPTAPDPIPPPLNINSPDPLSLPSSTTSTRCTLNRVSSTSSAPSKLRIADKIYSRKEKDKGAEPKPKPARTQPYGPPYNWMPPTPGAWAMVEGSEEPATTERRQKRASAPPNQTVPSPVTYIERDRAGSMPFPLPAL